MEEVKRFLEKLKDERNELNSEIRFLSKHKFNKESNYLNERVSVINTILYELESVIQNNTKGYDSKFNWTI